MKFVWTINAIAQGSTCLVSITTLGLKQKWLPRALDIIEYYGTKKSICLLAGDSTTAQIKKGNVTLNNGHARRK